MNLSRVSNPPKTGFQLRTVLNFEKSNTILSIQYLSRGLNSLNSDSDGLINCSLKYRSLQHKVKKCKYLKVKVCDKGVEFLPQTLIF